MKKKHQKKILWLYEKNHLKQPFIKLSAETLFLAKHKISIVDTANLTHPNLRYDHTGIIKNIDRFPFKNIILKSVKNGFGSYKFNIGLILVMAIYVIRRKPDIVMSSLPGGLLACYLASYLVNIRLIYYPLELYGEQKSKYSHILKYIEKYILNKRVDGLITQNKHRATVYHNERGLNIKSEIIHNYKKYTGQKYTESMKKQLNIAYNKRVVVYEGLLTEGRSLENLILSIEYLPNDVQIVLIGKKSSKWDGIYNALKIPHSFKKRIHQDLYIKPWKLCSFISEADVGVIIYENTPRNNYFCEPGKLSDYIYGDVPVIAPNYPTIAPVIEQNEIGVLFDTTNPKDIADAIIKVLSCNKLIWKTAIDKAKTKLIWDTQEKILVDYVTDD